MWEVGRGRQVAEVGVLGLPGSALNDAECNVASIGTKPLTVKSVTVIDVELHLCGSDLAAAGL